MNTKRIAQFLLGLGTLVISIALQLATSAQNSLDACTSRNSVNSTIFGGGSVTSCNGDFPAGLVVLAGTVILLIGVAMAVGHSAQTREWVLVWGALATWAIGVGILYF